MTRTTIIDLVDRLRISWTSCHARVNDERAEAADEIERLRKERDEARHEVRYFWLRSEACLEGNYGGGGRDLYKRLRDEFPERWGTDPVEPKWGSNP